MTAPLRIANVGAEEQAPADVPAVAAVAALWRGLFEAPPAFEWLPRGDDVAVAWLNTPEAHAEAEAAGRALAGAAPECVARVHDKAFAHAVAQRERLLPRCLEGLVVALDPETLLAANGVDALAEIVAGWPDWARERFTLKPRWGSSGRGRVAGTAGRVDTPELRGALPRLARHGGALLEPWLERTDDLSATFWIEPGEGLRLVGTTDQRTAPSGLYRGARGSVDSRGRVGATSRHDEAARELALTFAHAASAEGYTGPLGVDLFAFRTPDDETALRVAEINARYTVGCIAVGLVRRQLPRLREERGLEPGQRMHFALELSHTAAPSREVLEVRLAPELGAGSPALLFAPDAESLAAACGAQPAPSA